jgi:acyl-CoA synthetase (AMP-forming)/AMP-acid ligase II
MLLRALVPKHPHPIPLNLLSHFNRRLSKSSVQGPLEPPLSSKTLAHYFQTEVLDKYHARPALICRKEAPRAHGGPPTHNLGRVSSYLTWSYEEFDRHINALARGLLSMGVKTGDRVGVIMGNNRYVSSTLSWSIQ